MLLSGIYTFVPACTPCGLFLLSDITLYSALTVQLSAFKLSLLPGQVANCGAGGRLYLPAVRFVYGQTLRTSVRHARGSSPRIFISSRIIQKHNMRWHARVRTASRRRPSQEQDVPGCVEQRGAIVADCGATYGVPPTRGDSDCHRRRGNRLIQSGCRNGFDAACTIFKA